MSLLSTFIQKQLLHAVEQQFINHAPDIQEKIIEEMKSFSQECMDWATKKIKEKDDEKDDR